MLRATGTNISIITNFGCNKDCWYCIWKKHTLKNVNLKTDWLKLEEFLNKNNYKGKVSISGGGDSLFEYAKRQRWWNNFFELAHKYNMLVDIHTREKLVDDKFWKKINKCSFSSDVLYQDIRYLRYLNELVEVRIVHVVTAKTTNAVIEAFLSFQAEMDCQFTIKELIGFDDNGRYEQIKRKYPFIYYLDAGDYNTYYMPDNTVKEKFIF